MVGGTRFKQICKLLTRSVCGKFMGRINSTLGQIVDGELALEMQTN
jgi:hypothetical protein